MWIGIIPAQQFDQNGAMKLAICNDIGQASYDRVIVAAEMCNQVNALHASKRNYVKMKAIIDRCVDCARIFIDNTLTSKMMFSNNQISNSLR